MNKIVCHTDHITPNRTLETITCSECDKILCIYNYEGTHFRLFIDLLELAKFFELGTEPQYNFMEEEKMDFFIEEYLKCTN